MYSQIHTIQFQNDVGVKQILSSDNSFQIANSLLVFLNTTVGGKTPQHHCKSLLPLQPLKT